LKWKRKSSREVGRIIRRIQHPEKDIELSRVLAQRVLAAAGLDADQLLRVMPHIRTVEQEMKLLDEKIKNMGLSREDLAKSKEELKERIRPLNYSEWSKVISENFPETLPYATQCASVIAQLLIKDTVPFALVLAGVPSSLKTTVLSFFDTCSLVHKVDVWTPSSFVSHYARKKTEDLETVDLLPRIQNKTLIVPDFGTLFSLPKDHLIRNLSILTRVLDGEGLITHSAVHGERGYTGQYNFMLLGSTIPLPHKSWTEMANFGSRLFFSNIESKPMEEEDFIKMLQGTAYREKLNACRNATNRFILHLTTKHPTPIEWDTSKDDKKALAAIVQLAAILSKLRGAVNVAAYTYETENGETKEVKEYTMPIIENPIRAAARLYNFARSHALIQDRTYVTLGDVLPIQHLVLSSAPYERIKVFKHLIEKDMPLSTIDLENQLPCSRSTAHRTMETLNILGLVDVAKTDLKAVKIMTLKDEYKQALKALKTPTLQ